MLLELILKQSEIYLDEFSGCLEGLLDAVDLLYGAEVKVSMENIQALLKFSLMYSVDELATLSFQWVTEEMSMNNLFTFCQMGLFVKSIDVERDDILIGCKDFIQRSAVDDFVEVGKYWPEDQDVLKFLINPDLLPMTVSIITNWIIEEKTAILVLDRIEDGPLQETLVRLPSQALSSFFEAMQDACVTVPSLKRVCKLQSALIGKEKSPNFKKLQIDSGAILKSLEPKLWRNFDINQMLLLHYHYGITDYFFAEIMLDWISFKKPSQKVFDQLWVVIEGSKLTNDYVTALGNSIITHCSNMVIPKADVAGDKYEQGKSRISESDFIIEQLTNTDSDTNESNRVRLLDKVCRIKGCTLPNHSIMLKLQNAIPCYQLGAEYETDGYHYHHDKVHHWYSTEEKQGQRVLLSLITNNFNTVIKKVTAAKAIQIHYFHST